MLPKLCLTFKKPTYGYWDYGPKGGGIFKIENINGVFVDSDTDIEHPGPNRVIQWGSFTLNFWFNCGSGRSWREAASIAKRRLENLLNVPGKVEILWTPEDVKKCESEILKVKYGHLRES